MTEAINYELDRVDAKRAIAKIAEQATTGTSLTPSPEGWVSALPHLENVACKWQFEDSLKDSYLWYEDGMFRASNLPSGLEDREGRDLDRIEAITLLQGGVFHSPIELSEAKDIE